jgi:poly-gamma-glutamate capsule biosynthesis protein CapA/YwtB (metallophosphatase superfamily)
VADVTRVLTVLFCGDVMTGRGIDQILPCPGDPTLREGYLRDARRYVELAESANGPIPTPVNFAWPWGEALRTAADLTPDVRVSTWRRASPETLGSRRATAFTTG